MEEALPPTPAQLDYTNCFDELVPFPANKPMKHTYRVEITRAVFDQQAFAVYQRYEQKIHGKEDKDKKSYERFLCQSPLYDPTSEAPEEKFSPWDKHIDDQRDKKPHGHHPRSQGSFHMRHYIDDELFAVGVLDYTPKCLSSVYLFYDPKWEFLSPGTFAAIREIEHVRKIMTTGQFPPDFQWYYMGLYYQSCQKSVYKGKYRPSQVACPHSWNFVELTDEVR